MSKEEQELYKKVMQETEEKILAVNSPSYLREYYFLEVADSIKIRDWLDYYLNSNRKDERVVKFLQEQEHPLAYMLDLAYDIDGFDDQLEQLLNDDIKEN